MVWKRVKELSTTRPNQAQCGKHACWWYGTSGPQNSGRRISAQMRLMPSIDLNRAIGVIPGAWPRSRLDRCMPCCREFAGPGSCSGGTAMSTDCSQLEEGVVRCIGHHDSYTFELSPGQSVRDLAALVRSVPPCVVCGQIRARPCTGRTMLVHWQETSICHVFSLLCQPAVQRTLSDGGPPVPASNAGPSYHLLDSS